MAEALQCSVCKDLLKEAITATECAHSCEEPLQPFALIRHDKAVDIHKAAAAVW
jgi:hypothetical protein